MSLQYTQFLFIIVAVRGNAPIVSETLVQNYNLRGVFTMGLGKKTIDDQNYCGKKVLVRCDFNVPMKDGVITDTKRIVGALPTVKYLVDHNAKVILCSHMGRPHNIFNDVVKLDKKEKKKIDAMPEAEQAEATAKALEAAKGDVKKFSLAPVAAEPSSSARKSSWQKTL